MAKLPPAWQAHHATDYDSAMTARCTALLAQIISDPARRRDILADPRNLHHELLASFAPPGHDEYAGTYRDTPGTSLANRRIFSESLMEPAGQYEFCLPGQVPARINQLLEHTLAWLANTKADDYGKLLGLAYAFCWFGKIHPFLDGNGHVQRAIFAAMATDFGYPLSPRFAIHPRPFDRLLAIALEIFTRARPPARKTRNWGWSPSISHSFLTAPSMPRASMSGRRRLILDLHFCSSLSTQIDALLWRSRPPLRYRYRAGGPKGRLSLFRHLPKVRVFPKPSTCEALKASRITKILGALSKVRDVNPISKGGADGGAVRAGWLDFRRKKQGAAGITTAAPYIAG